MIVLGALLVGSKHLYGGEPLDLVLSTKALVLVGVHSPHLDHTLHGRGEGRGRGRGRGRGEGRKE